MNAQRQIQVNVSRKPSRSRSLGMWVAAGLLVAVGLTGTPAHAQRLLADTSGAVAWSGAGSGEPQNAPGLLRTGYSSAGRERGYLLFRPPNPAFGLGGGPARIYTYVVNFPPRGELTLAAYTVAARFGPRDNSAETDPAGGFLWNQLQAGAPIATGPASPRGEFLGNREYGAGEFAWHAAPRPGAGAGLQGPEAYGLDATPTYDGRPVPGWYYLELDPTGSEALRSALIQAQQAGGYLRLALLAQDTQADLILAGADDADHQPTLFMGPTCELNLQGEGRVRINGVEEDLPFVADLPQGEQITLEAECPSGYRFASWTGDLSTRDARLVLQLNSPLDLTVNYQQAISWQPAVVFVVQTVFADDWYRDCDRQRDYRCWAPDRRDDPRGGGRPPRGGFWPPDSHRHDGNPGNGDHSHDYGPPQGGHDGNHDPGYGDNHGGQGGHHDPPPANNNHNGDHPAGGNGGHTDPPPANNNHGGQGQSGGSGGHATSGGNQNQGSGNHASGGNQNQGSGHQSSGGNAGSGTHSGGSQSGSGSHSSSTGSHAGSGSSGSGSHAGSSTSSHSSSSSSSHSNSGSSSHASSHSSASSSHASGGNSGGSAKHGRDKDK